MFDASLIRIQLVFTGHEGNTSDEEEATGVTTKTAAMNATSRPFIIPYVKATCRSITVAVNEV